jgi:hypothetical protein
MKIPPEPKDATLNKSEEERGNAEQGGSGEVVRESNRDDVSRGSRDNGPSQASRQSKQSAQIQRVVRDKRAAPGGG